MGFIINKLSIKSRSKNSKMPDSGAKDMQREKIDGI
jgi:hypothetical protein